MSFLSSIDLEGLYLLVALFGFILFIILIITCASIINISSYLKRLVDLEYKKYNEAKESFTRGVVDGLDLKLKDS